MADSTGYVISALKADVARLKTARGAAPKPEVMALQHRGHCQVHSWEQPKWINCDCGAIVNWYENEIKRLSEPKCPHYDARWWCRRCEEHYEPRDRVYHCPRCQR